MTRPLDWPDHAATAILQSFGPFFVEELGQLQGLGGVVALLVGPLLRWVRHAIENQARELLAVEQAHIDVVPTHLENERCSEPLIIPLPAKERVSEPCIVDPYLANGFIDGPAVDCHAAWQREPLFRTKNVEGSASNAQTAVRVRSLESPV